MYLCYVDEAGCPGALPSATSDIQPALVISGLFVPQARLSKLTADFLHLKQRFNPNLVSSGGHWLDITKCEIKGSDLRRDVRRAGRNRRRAVFGFLDQTLQLLETHHCNLVSRAYVKAPGETFRGQRVYTAAVQALCACFQRYLTEADSHGFMVADSRTPGLNSAVAHSIFTQKFKADGDAYDRILEMPTFGHSENHVPLQITDLLCSAILMPMVTNTYCAGHITSVHIRDKDGLIRRRYALRIRDLCFRFHDNSRMRGGITVNDAILKRSANGLFAP